MEKKGHMVTMQSGDIPNNIKDVTDDISEEVIGCEHAELCNDKCVGAFKISPFELQLYRQLHIPIPRLCPNCRHFERFRMRNPLKLWRRSCMCKEGDHGHENTCQNQFETTYSPERIEKVYCESCYQKAVL
jgi:hypothetical protein